MAYETQLVKEALAVGGLNLGVYLFVKAALPLPKRFELVHLFVTGVLIHLGCEATGLNDWYLTGGAAYNKSVQADLDFLSEGQEEQEWSKSLESQQLSALLG